MQHNYCPDIKQVAVSHVIVVNMTCQNCKTVLSCGCQRRVATNGVVVCSNCLSKYETELKLRRSNPQLKQDPYDTKHKNK